MAEVDAGVDHAEDHSLAGKPLLQRRCCLMHRVGTHMAAHGILCRFDRHCQLQSPDLRAFRQRFERAAGNPDGGYRADYGSDCSLALPEQIGHCNGISAHEEV